MKMMMHCKCAGKGEGSSIGAMALQKGESPPHIQVLCNMEMFCMIWYGMVQFGTVSNGMV